MPHKINWRNACLKPLAWAVIKPHYQYKRFNNTHGNYTNTIISLRPVYFGADTAEEAGTDS
jgi:hypothetical protein